MTALISLQEVGLFDLQTKCVLQDRKKILFSESPAVGYLTVLVCQVQERSYGTYGLKDRNILHCRSLHPLMLLMALYVFTFPRFKTVRDNRSFLWCVLFSGNAVIFVSEGQHA